MRIIINGYIFETSPTMTLQFHDFDNGPVKELEGFNYPMSNGGANISDKNREKIFNIRGVLKGSSLSDLNNKIDIFKKYIYKNGELPLEIQRDMGGSLGLKTLYGFCNIQNNTTIIRGPQDITFCRFDISLKISSGYLTLGTQENYNYGTLNTGGSGIISVVNPILKGNGLTKPVYEITNLSGSIIEFIDIESNNGKVRVIFDIPNGDTLIIDTVYKTVMLNNVLLDYQGNFPEIHPLDGNLIIRGSTSKNIGVVVKYFPTFY